MLEQIEGSAAVAREVRAQVAEALKQLPARAQVGFGVVNPRTADIEPPEQIAARVREVAKLLGPERIFLNPQAGHP